MPYIGRTPLTGAYQLCDTITTSATATYNLLVGGSAVIPGSAQNCIVSLNGVIQAPVSAFTVSGSQITFASALTSSDVIDFILILGNVFDIGTPTNGAVTNSSLNSNVITGQTAVTVPATDDVLLCYDTSATALRKITFADFGSTPAFEAYRSSSDQSIVDLTATKVQFATELFDTDSAYDNATNYRFTPQVAGKYFVYSQVMMKSSTGTFNLSQFNIDLRKNGSTLRLNQMYNNTTAFNNTSSVYGSVDMNGSSDYLEIFITTRSATAANSNVDSTNQSTFFGAYRLIGV